MKKKSYKNLYIILLAVIFAFLQLPLYAIEDVSDGNSMPKTEKAAKKKAKQKKSKKAETQNAVSDNFTPVKTAGIVYLDFDSLSAKAIEHSYDLKIADYSTLIAKTSVMDARSEYLPKIYFGAGTEYNKSFRENDFMQGMGGVSVGDSYINPYTRFQSVLGITLSYNLFDFGVRRARLDMSKTDAALKELKKSQMREELLLSLADRYIKAEVYFKQLDIQKQIAEIEQKNYELSKKLFNAKLISRTELNDRRVKSAAADKETGELSKLLQETLNWLSFYTGEEYTLDNVQIGGLKKIEFNPNEDIDYTKSTAWQVYEKEIKIRQLAHTAAKRNFLPKLSIYGKYYIFGSNKSNYGKSIEDMKPSSAAAGMSLTVPVFDGLRNLANVKRAGFELEQIQIERDKAISEWLIRIASLKSNMLYIDKQLSENKTIIEELEDKYKALARMHSSRLIYLTELNDAEVQLLEQKMDYERNKTAYAGILKAIQILTAGGDLRNGS